MTESQKQATQAVTEFAALVAAAKVEVRAQYNTLELATRLMRRTGQDSIEAHSTSKACSA